MCPVPSSFIVADSPTPYDVYVPYLRVPSGFPCPALPALPGSCAQDGVRGPILRSSSNGSRINTDGSSWGEPFSVSQPFPDAHVNMWKPTRMKNSTTGIRRASHSVRSVMTQRGLAGPASALITNQNLGVDIRRPHGAHSRPDLIRAGETGLRYGPISLSAFPTCLRLISGISDRSACQRAHGDILISWP